MSNKNKNRQNAVVGDNAETTAADDGFIVEVDGKEIPMSSEEVVDALLSSGSAELVPAVDVKTEDVEEETPAVETHAVETTVVEEKKEEAPVVEKPKNVKDLKNSFSTMENKEKKNAVSSSIVPGASARIKGTATNTFTGSIIPPVARNKKYVVSKVSDGRVILVAGTFSIALKEQDVLVI